MHDNFNRLRYFGQFLQSLLLIGMAFLIFAMAFHVKKIQEAAQVLYCTGIIRSGAQRLAKLEIAGEESGELEHSLDGILADLQYGGGEYRLPVLPDAGYTERLGQLAAYWEEMKAELDLARSTSYRQTRLLAMSEEYSRLADGTVTAAQAYAQKCIRHIRRIETFSILFTAVIVLLLLKQSVNAVQMARFNRELHQKAYTDLHTGLPNKSRCEELFENHEPLSSPTCCIMFDLNNLKEVNDTLGHVAGDTIILNFSHILRTSVPEEHFVGRYGGDEFIAILRDTSAEQVLELLKNIRSEVSRFNRHSGSIHLSYACGYAISAPGCECCLTALLERADHYMYTNKRKIKQNRHTGIPGKEKAPAP